MIIDRFSGEYRFLSNFHESRVQIFGHMCPTVEHAYQAAKCNKQSNFLGIVSCQTPGMAKKIGRVVAIRDDWESLKDVIMLNLLRQKFLDPILRAKLLETEHAQLIEGNTWGDRYWGMCSGSAGKLTGLNKLGQMLMVVRGECQ